LTSMRTRVFITLVILLLAVLTASFPVVWAAEDNSAPTNYSPSSGETDSDILSILPESGFRRKLPVVIPPAEEVLERLRTLRQERGSRPEAKAEPEKTPPQQILDLRIPADLRPPGCGRAIPTKQEFLNMLRTNPADANQILRKCNIDVRSISPLPQLPVSNRQLPEDRRQRPVGTWGR